MLRRLIAHCTVTDLDRAEDWYTRLLGRRPDRRPMPGLIEWQLGDSYGLQLWSEFDRAGRSTVVVEGTGARILQLADPDGNRVVLPGE